MMKLYLNRTRTRQETTDGVLLSSNGDRICDTAEHTPTMLPAGVYNVRFKHHRKSGCRAPFLELVNASGKASGFILRGNGVHARDFGTTIIVGEHLVPGVVINSRSYFNNLFKRIEINLNRKKPVEIIIN